LFASLVQLTAAAKKEKKPIKTGAGSGHITKQTSRNLFWRLSISMGTAYFKNVNNYLNTNIYSYLETSGGKSYNLYLNAVHFFNTSVN
jgi:hypothetical protein